MALSPRATCWATCCRASAGTGALPRVCYFFCSVSPQLQPVPDLMPPNPVNHAYFSTSLFLRSRSWCVSQGPGLSAVYRGGTEQCITRAISLCCAQHACCMQRCAQRSCTTVGALRRSHSGITRLYQNVRLNGYQILFLSSRAIAQVLQPV